METLKKIELLVADGYEVTFVKGSPKIDYPTTLMVITKGEHVVANTFQDIALAENFLEKHVVDHAFKTPNFVNTCNTH